MGNHKIVHVELSSNNPEESSRFYSELFGWKHQHMAEWDYHTWDNGDGTGGGYNRPREASEQGFAVRPGDVHIYISTDSVSDTLAKAQELGAKVVQPRTDIPGMGAYAIFADPTGNQIGLYESLKQAEAA
jgi:uncharacterized protein